MKHFKDKVAIVTGGASGIGRALCEEMAQKGAIIIIADINEEGAKEVALNIIQNGGKASAMQLDVTKAEEVQKLINKIASEYNRLDYMFNNAGIVVIGEVRDQTLEDWKRTIDINLMGVIYGTTMAYSLMIKQGFGHIINTASIAGLVGFPTITPYVATKHAVVGLSKSLRIEAVEFGVKVSVICPGFVKTPIFNSPILKVNPEDLLNFIPKNIPVTPQKAAQFILRGVASNKEIITFPPLASLFCWLHRQNSIFAKPMLNKMIKDFRSLRKE